MSDEDPPFIGNWELKCILGNGSFGQVNLWKNKINKKKIAIKKCTAFLKNLPKADYDKLQSRWNNELEIMRQAKCEYIIRAIDVEPINFIEILNQTNLSGFPLLFMEYCEGGDLRNFLCKIDNSNGLIESEIKSILICLRTAIEYLHNIGITHRDIKPENILLQQKDEANFYKLADLGYAKELQITSGHSVVGTSEYIAPEIIGSPKYSKRVDYWSMGIIVFEIICGIRPFLPNSNWITRLTELRNKKSKEIAIIPTNTNSEYKKCEYLFEENRITNYFKEQIEGWLRLALEFNEKQRGSEVVNRITVPDEIQLQPQPPEYVVTFYTKLDEIINTKILTIFCLCNYKFLSYPINQLNNLNDLLMAIENDTKIPAKEIYIILPIEQTKMFKIEENTKVIDFYLEDVKDSPMLYVTRYKQVLERKTTEPYVSELIIDILDIDHHRLELSGLKEFARHVLFLYRNEQRHYLELLNGLKTYAINLNDLIVKLKPMIFQVNNKTMIACANINLHINAISYSKQKLEDNDMLQSCRKIVNEWDSYVDKLENDYKLQEINARNQKSYESVTRRSKEAIKSKLFEIQDFYNVKILEEKYDKLRKTRNLSDEVINKTEHIFQQYVNDCITTRTRLLKSRELEHIQKDIIGIHTEFATIYNIVNKLNDTLDKYENKIQQASFKHLDELCEIYINFTKQKNEMVKKDDSPLNGNIEEPNNPVMNNTNVLEKSSNHNCNNEQFAIHKGIVTTLPNNLHSQPSSTMNSMNLSLFGDDTNDIIIENTDNLMILQSFSNHAISDN